MDRFYFTAAGMNYAAKTAVGYILQFTRGKFGSGLPETDVGSMTDLVDPLGELSISKKSTNGNQVTIQTQFTNVVGDTTLPAFHLTEIGLFGKLLTPDGLEDPASPEILIGYAYVTGDDNGDYIPNTPTEFIINWPFSISNTENVSVTVSLTAYALQKDLDELKNKVDSKTHVDVMYRDEDKKEPNTIYFIIDEDAPEEVPENIDAVSYNNVIFAQNAPETAEAENWFETDGTTSGGDAGVTDTSKIVMQDGLLKVLKEPDENTDFLNK